MIIYMKKLKGQKSPKKMDGWRWKRVIVQLNLSLVETERQRQSALSEDPSAPFPAWVHVLFKT